MRSIHILHHSISPFRGQYPEADPLHYTTGIPMLFARAIQKAYPAVETEVWRPETTLKRANYVWQDADQITHRVFPSRYLRYRVEYSGALVDAVERIAEERDVVLWIHGIYNLHAYRFARLLTNARAIFQSHGGLPGRSQYAISRHAFKKIFYLPFGLTEARFLAHAPHVFVISEHERQALTTAVPALESRISVSPTGIDFGHFCPGNRAAARTAVGIAPDCACILFVGRLTKDKGVLTLVEAFTRIAAEHQDAHLFIAGSGPLEDVLHARIAQAGHADRVHCLGYVPPTALPNYYRAADVTVMPSQHEWFGKVAAESLACGVPVIATAVGGAPDIVNAFRSGFLVAPDSVAELARGLDVALVDGFPTLPDIASGEQAFGWSNKLAHAFQLFGVLPATQSR